MASQFSALIQHRFSYCLAPFDDVTPRPLVLRFGEDIPQLPPQSVGSTQLIASPTSYFFYLGLKDISVAGILKGSSVSVLGAWQQQNKRIIYDGGRGVLEFADENCMNDIA
ncbi:hypothetical protein PVK06_048783 [Gossypium arboreum]|uniref:Peptidase A1 domain-containing protein n=1 Tax=Gossypium arboreum TaxID=29729 RepID=A0ABR0MGX3_GOSAR|nr:hypothetical protein PVK06_048783 [Gossypium arboreum]